jgi:hypothetical protein
MTNWRDTLRPMRRIVHGTMNIPALYLRAAGQTPQRVNVRLHRRFDTSAVDGVGEGYAGMLDMDPRLVFARNEVAMPERDSIVILSATEMYDVQSAEPPDDEYVKAHSRPMPASQMAIHWKPEYADLLL